MTRFDDNYPKGKTEMTDAQLKDLALQSFKQEEVKLSGFPTETISLPSEGKVYTEDSPLHSGKIEMKYMTAREEDILTSQNLIKQGVVLDKLMQSLIVTPINYNDLVIGDKNAIMIASRILGYGKNYEVSVECPHCEKPNIVNVDLTTLPDQNIPEYAVMVSPGVFEFKLPQSERIVNFKLLTSGEDKKISKELETRKKSNKDGVDRELTTRLKSLIVSVDNNTDKKYIDNFVDNELFAVDSRALRGYMKSVSPDTKFEIDFVCTECGNESEALQFNIDTNFFWPKS
jgi:hypothetical protein